jgi:hypothetical protein
MDPVSGRANAGSDFDLLTPELAGDATTGGAIGLTDARRGTGGGVLTLAAGRRCEAEESAVAPGGDAELLVRTRGGREGSGVTERAGLTCTCSAVAGGTLDFSGGGGGLTRRMLGCTEGGGLDGAGTAGCVELTVGGG